MTNCGYCNHCQKLVAVHREERENRIYLVKDCKDCGSNETLISNNAHRYKLKSSIIPRPQQGDHVKKGCKINCSSCKSHKAPGMVFVDITNRCNMNCPICINNTPAMGFKFEPPLDYFKKIFSHLSQLSPRPAIKIFGGEPTLRDDLFEIIKMATSVKLRVAVVTNGIKLADLDYCKKILESGASIRLSYDGGNARLYSELRNNPSSLIKKLEAIENIDRISKDKITLMTMIANGYNENELHEFFSFCHSRARIIGNICFMPLAHTWDNNKLSAVPDRITSEDIESMVGKAVHGGKVEFLPAGMLNEFPVFLKYLLHEAPSFEGAHPNCESITFLVSNGSQYVSISNFFKRSLYDIVAEIKAEETKIEKQLTWFARSAIAKLLNSFGLKEFIFRLWVYSRVIKIALRNIDYKEMLGEHNSIKAYSKGLKIFGKIITGKNPLHAFAQYSKINNIVQVIVIPFEDKTNMESERLQHCPTHFAYMDPDTDQVRTLPACSWNLFKNDIMRRIADKYTSCGSE